MDQRLLELLRLDPEFVKAGSFHIVTHADKLLVTWTGMAILEPADLLTLATTPKTDE